MAVSLSLRMKKRGGSVKDELLVTFDMSRTVSLAHIKLSSAVVRLCIVPSRYEAFRSSFLNLLTAVCRQAN